MAMAVSHASENSFFIGIGPLAGGIAGLNALGPRLLQAPGRDMAKTRLSRAHWPHCGAGFTKNYALAWSDRAANPLESRPPMTLSVAHPTEAAHPLRGLLPLWVGVAIYALFLLAGNRLLIDPDTMWQITVGQWILDHRAVPVTDVYSFTMRGQPGISTQWLSQ